MNRFVKWAAVVLGTPVAFASTTTACSSTGIIGPTGYEANVTAVSALAEGTCEPLTAHFLVSDPDFTILEATELCANRGYVFSAGNGRPSSFQCCASAPTTTTSETNGACVEFPLGTAESCADSNVWNATATEACAGFAASPSLFGYRMSDPCGDGRYRYAKVTCCASGTRGRGADVCAIGALTGTHGRCLADESATLEGQRTCTDQGLFFSRAIPQPGSCQPGTLEAEVIVCCDDGSDTGDDDDDADSDAGAVMP